MFAFNNKYPIFFTSPRRPFRFDYFEPDVDLSFLKISEDTRVLTTFGEKKNIGIAKELLWEKLLFLLSLEGLAPLSNLCCNIRYDDNTVVCSNEYSKIMEFHFDNCFYFGDLGSTGFVEKTLDEATYICYDYIAFNRGGKHEIDHIHTGDDFVSEIWFYGSDRIDGNTPVRDACAVSKLTGPQLLDFDYSETMARFKVVHEMETRGMKGAFAHEYTTAGNPKYYKFRTTSINRKKHKRDIPGDPTSSNISLPALGEETLCEALPKGCLGYDRFLRHW
jgi:hypothetical protein